MVKRAKLVNKLSLIGFECVVPMRRSIELLYANASSQNTVASLMRDQSNHIIFSGSQHFIRYE